MKQTPIIQFHKSNRKTKMTRMMRKRKFVKGLIHIIFELINFLQIVFLVEPEVVINASFPKSEKNEVQNPTQRKYLRLVMNVRKVSNVRHSYNFTSVHIVANGSIISLCVIEIMLTILFEGPTYARTVLEDLPKSTI